MSAGRLIGIALAAAAFTMAAPASAQPAIHLQSTDSVGPRALEPQTERSVVRGYLESWKALNQAMENNRPELLAATFLGDAKDKLTATIQEQRSAQISTSYHDRSHDLQIVFYSPEGLSIELLDTVSYDVEIRCRGRLLGTQHIQARYLAVLTPTEVRWKVRVFQSDPAQASRSAALSPARTIQVRTQGALE